jgi:hypothetical protein
MLCLRLTGTNCIVGIAILGAASHNSAAMPLLLNIDREIYCWAPGEPEPVPTGYDLQGNKLRLAIVVRY